jgi:L-asparaginase II
MQGVLDEGAPGLGVAIKVSDGDITGRARHVVAVEVLNQLGILSEQDLAVLSRFGPATPLINQAHIHVGDLRPVFQLIV